MDNRTNTRVTRIESESSINSSDSESLPFLHQAAKKNSALHYRTIDVPTSAIFNRQGLLAAFGHRKQGSSSRERKASRTRKEQFVASELAADYQEKRGSTSSRPGSPIPEEPEFAIKLE